MVPHPCGGGTGLIPVHPVWSGAPRLSCELSCVFGVWPNTSDRGIFVCSSGEKLGTGEQTTQEQLSPV